MYVSRAYPDIAQYAGEDEDDDEGDDEGVEDGDADEVDETDDAGKHDHDDGRQTENHALHSAVLHLTVPCAPGAPFISL